MNAARKKYCATAVQLKITILTVSLSAITTNRLAFHNSHQETFQRFEVVKPPRPHSYLSISVNISSRCKQYLASVPFRQPQHVEGTTSVCLQGFHRIYLQTNNRANKET
jgi:hypothetical protein